MNDFLQWLESRHKEIMACENNALDALKKSNIEAYNDKMREKAKMLSNLAYDSKPHLSNVPENLRMKVEHSLDNFSRSAATSLKLDSIFYMSALLYRDDHKSGEPDNLEVFIGELKKS